MMLQIAIMHLYDTGKENGEQSDKQKGESKYMLQGEVSHKWETCSTFGCTIVKCLLSQLALLAAGHYLVRIKRHISS